MGFASVALPSLWVVTNRVPRTPRGKVGILLAVTCDDEHHDRQVRADFVRGLVTQLERDQEGSQFHVTDLPAHISRQIAGFTVADRYLTRARAHMILFGTVRKRQLRGQSVHVMTFDGRVRHAPASDEARRELSSQFGAVVPKGWTFPVDADFFAFETTAEWTDVAIRYIIGLAALISGDAAYAEKLLVDVEQKIRSGRHNVPPMQAVGLKLSGYLKSLYEMWRAALAYRYTMTRDPDILPLFEAVSSKLLARDPTSVGGGLAKAMCLFMLHGDVSGARRILYGLKNANDVTWRYSLAFLDGYEGNLDNAESEYDGAFRGPLNDVTVPVQCEEFIQYVLEAEPSRFQLHYCAGLINFYAKEDMSSAARDLELFVALTPPGIYSRQVARARDLLTKIAEGAAA
jgi:hypothetical protein